MHKSGNGSSHFFTFAVIPNPWMIYQTERPIRTAAPRPGWIGVSSRPVVYSIKSIEEGTEAHILVTALKSLKKGAVCSWRLVLSLCETGCVSFIQRANQQRLSQDRKTVESLHEVNYAIAPDCERVCQNELSCLIV